ncbi:MAG: FAD-binding protein [Gammaproteobacteria bacterium]
MTTLVIAEHDNQKLKSTTLNTITAARQLQQPITVVVAGHPCTEVTTAVSTIEGVERVLLADHPAYEHFLAENLASLVTKLAKDHQYVLAPASTFGKKFLPRVAALLDVGMLSDVVKILSPDTFVRPIYAGNALTTLQSQDALKIMTIRGIAFAPALMGKIAVPIEKVDDAATDTRVKFISQQLTPAERPELTAARIVIAGGRGLQSAENFQLLEKIADQLGAAVGASRAAVDAGWVPNDYQVGQTGKAVAPELYIAIGISGAIQHLAGMKDSKVIVAINKDPDAPIFQVADYGLVADLFKVLPELAEILRK